MAGCRPAGHEQQNRGCDYAASDLRDDVTYGERFGLFSARSDKMASWLKLLPCS